MADVIEKGVSDIEATIRAHHEAGDLAAAVTAAFEGYGRELLGYLVATMRSEHDAGEVFSQLSEDIWRGLPTFGWRCTFRTWSYTLARNAAVRFRRAPANQAHRHAPLSRAAEIAFAVRTRTLPHLRTEIKDRFAELRESLEPDDQALLILRVNRQLSWKEIAQILDGSDADDSEALSRGSAKYRQRFQKVKRDLVVLAQRDGLLSAADE